MTYPKEVALRTVLGWGRQPPDTVQEMLDPVGRHYWLPARSERYAPTTVAGLRHRLRCAWLVFTGRADVLHWK